MNHMPIPDENFENLLHDYSADAQDDGFSDFIIGEIETAEKRQARAKRICLNSAIFVGGLIAGKQILAIFDSWQNSALTTAASSVPLLPIMSAIALMFMLWLLEQQEFSL